MDVTDFVILFFIGFFIGLFSRLYYARMTGRLRAKDLRPRKATDTNIESSTDSKEDEEKDYECERKAG